MKSGYELWDLSTGNIIGTFDTAEDALEIVRNAIEDWVGAKQRHWRSAPSTTPPTNRS